MVEEEKVKLPLMNFVNSRKTYYKEIDPLRGLISFADYSLLICSLLIVSSADNM